MGRFLVVLALWMAQPCSVAAQDARRAAFVVGNAVYDHAPDLANPEREASLVAETLRALGFSVTQVRNASREELTRSFAAFLDNNRAAEVTLLYFAGHGMQFEGRNHLLGRDARLRSEFDIAAETLSLDRMVDMMRRTSRAALVFVDACRNNPLADSFYARTQSETRTLMTRGLAPVRSASEGAMLVFAASPGQVAYDGETGNSPFAAALARHLPAPRMEVLSLMKRVIRDVKVDTRGLQVPMVMNDLTAEIFLGSQADAVKEPVVREAPVSAVAAVAAPGPASSTPSCASDGQQEFTWLEKLRADIDAAYRTALSENSVAGLARFVATYPHGTKADTARERIDVLEARILMKVSDPFWNGGPIVQVSAEVAARAERDWGLNARDLRKIQFALNQRGFFAGATDGVAGPQTRAAVAAFQTSVDLPATGVVSPLTGRKLGVPYVRPGEARLSLR